MIEIRQKLGPLLIFLVVVAFAVACGDDDHVDGNDGETTNSAEVNEEQTDPNNDEEEPDSNDEEEGDGGPTSAEDCEEDETYDPTLEECVEAPEEEEPDPNGNDNTGNDTNGNDTNGNNTTQDSGECGPGSIIGQTCRPDGQVLPGAEVTLIGDDCDGQEFTMEMVADQDGNYEFENVDAGTHTVQIEAGFFFVEESIVVQKDEETDWVSSDAQLCLEGSGVSIAVIEGAYDDIGEILGGMEIEYDVVGRDMSFPEEEEDAAEFLGDLDEMNQYDILFIECGSLWNDLYSNQFGDPFNEPVDTDEILDNLRQFVENGSSLYVSDQAQPFIQKGLPEAVQFYDDSGGALGPRVGDVQDIEADVVSDELKAVIGPGTRLINFNLPRVAIAEDGGPDSTVHLRGDVESDEAGVIPDAALMLTYDDPVGGRALFTSFHNSSASTDDMIGVLESMIFQL